MHVVLKKVAAGHPFGTKDTSPFSFSAGLHPGGLATLPLAGLRWWNKILQTTPYNVGFGRFYPFWHLDSLKLPIIGESPKNRPRNFKLVQGFSCFFIFLDLASNSSGLRVLWWFQATKLPMYPKWSQEFQVFGYWENRFLEWKLYCIYEKLSCEEKSWRLT